MRIHADMAALRRHTDRRLAALDQERASWVPHWRELQRYVVPRRGRFLGTAHDGGRGGKLNQAILDTSGTAAARVLASGMMAGITSPARPWFRLTLADSDLADFPGARLWLDEAIKRMQRVIARSNIYDVLPVLYLELGVFGTAAVLLLEDFDDVVRAYPLTIGEYHLAASGRLAIDTLYRVFTMTVGQLCERFGREACSPRVQALYGEGRLDVEIEVVHAIEPNHHHMHDSPLAMAMPWRSLWYEKGSDATQVLALSGFADFPAMCPRWDVTGNDVYGRGPGMDALPDIRTLQVQAKRRASMIDKATNPPMVGPVSLKHEASNLLPGGITYLAETSEQRLRPAYEISPAWLQALAQETRDTREAVNRAFFVDLFLMVTQMQGVQPRNTLEIAERREEKMLMLGPVLERLHGELLDPMITRIFSVMQRRGLLPPAPPELEGRHLEIEYVSVLAQAQKAVATAGIERLAGFVGTLAGVKPDVADKFDFDQAVDEYADMLGVPARTIVPDERVAERRAARAQAAQAQAAVQLAMTGVQGAKLLSETDTGDGTNALQRLTSPSLREGGKKGTVKKETIDND